MPDITHRPGCIDHSTCEKMIRARDIAINENQRYIGELRARCQQLEEMVEDSQPRLRTLAAEVVRCWYEWMDSGDPMRSTKLDYVSAAMHELSEHLRGDSDGRTPV